MVKKLTNALDELFVKQKLTLYQAFECLKGNASLKKLADYILEALKSGMAFSNALKACPFVTFDSVYIAFIMLAERSGNLCETIAFLKTRCERIEQNKRKLIEVSLYPVFVILIAVGACVCLLNYTKLPLDFELVGALFMLLGFSTMVFYLMWRCLKEDSLLDALYALSFLVKSGHSISAAIGFAVNVAGAKSQVGAMLAEAKMKLEYGMPLSEALVLKGYAADLLYYAEKGGTTSDVFEKLAVFENEKFRQKRSICLSLAEPVFIVLTASFLLILIVHIFMPYMSNMNFL